MAGSLSNRVARLEQHLAPPAPDLVEHVATMLDRLASTDPHGANELLISFGLRPCYPVNPDPFGPDTSEENQ